MDLNKFYKWKQHSALADLAEKGTVLPETCLIVYERICEAGHGTPLDGGKVEITDAGRAAAPEARRVARRLLNELIMENHKLVRRLVNQLFKRSMTFSEEEDLYQSGLMALVRTLEKFDPARYSTKGVGHSFATYLRHWVRDHVQKSTQDQQAIKHPKGYGMPYSVFKKAEEILSRTGERATAEQLGSYKSKGKEYKITEELLNKWRAAQNNVVSLDSTHDDGAANPAIIPSGPYDGGVMSKASRTAYDAAESSKSPESILARAQREQLVGQIISELSPQEQTVLEMMREGEATNRKVGQLLGCNIDTARDFKTNLITKLKKRLGWRE